ncbi:hypothetical protein [Dickeya fangzhongdai]|uniref:hypothetical protein n=1 Tax=Dickeya fangzhongdai TaxID=1778540 RepID=UPI001AD98B09|nr:hypothetical protein [Dickeya fangzhongdai]MBO8132907.1 hypothetical protein [Dickeya fangzhongdai]
MKVRAILWWILVIVTPTAWADYRACNIINGQIAACGSWFQGSAPVLQHGEYRECTIE